MMAEPEPPVIQTWMVVVLLVVGMSGVVIPGGAALSADGGPVASVVQETPGGNLTFASPVGGYVVGTEATIAGTAPAGDRAVAVYVRGEDAWELLDLNRDGATSDADLIPVENGTWERTVTLSNTSALVQTPGPRTLAVVAASEARADGSVRGRIPTGVFGNLRSARTTLDVQTPSPAEGTVILDINNQVATEDGTVGVQGVAYGQEEVLVIFIDRRGRLASTLLSVDGNDAFEDEDVSLVTARGEELSEGLVVAAVFGVGRDGVVGDGEIEGYTRADLEALDANARQKIRERVEAGIPVRTQRQVLELFYDESVGDAGSDDLLLGDTFTYTDGRTSIEDVRPASEANAITPRPLSTGDTMLVQGLTNRKPDDNSIEVEVVNGPSAEAFDVAATDEWKTDGVWSVTIDVPPDVEPGTYTLESDDGENTASFQVTIRSNRGNETGGQETTERT